MALVYPDSFAYALCAIAGPYAITAGTNDTLSITVDGGSAQVFTLTAGAARTAAQIVTDLAALTSATASVITIGSATYVQIKTTSSSGASSTILFNAPTHDAKATLGFFGTNAYHGGAYVNTTFVGATKQNIIDGIETALLSAGWQTVSGHNTTNLLMQCSITPSADGSLIGRVRWKDNSANCATGSIENISGSKVGTSSTSMGMQLLPAAAKTFRVIANKHTAFVFTAGSTASPREFAAFGTVFVPSFMQGPTGLFECVWGHGAAQSDTDTTLRDSFRTSLAADGQVAGANTGASAQISNGAMFETGGGGTAIGYQRLVSQATVRAGNGSGYKWHDGSANTLDPILAFGITASTDEALLKGLLYGAAVITESFTADQTDTFNSHNWWFLTNLNTGVPSNALRGTLILATS